MLQLIIHLDSSQPAIQLFVSCQNLDTSIDSDASQNLDIRKNSDAMNVIICLYFIPDWVIVTSNPDKNVKYC